MQKIKIGIVGYGNLGKGVELAIRQNSDMELVGVFTRRDPESIQTVAAPAYPYNTIRDFVGKIDVMILCGGSATDLAVQTPEIAQMFHTIDSYDTHAKIPAYYDEVNKIASASQHTSIISVGWDPGMFSISRLYNNCILPQGKDYTFWGKGVSQGHSDAIKRVQGVKAAKQYTIPIEDAVNKVREGKNPELTTRERHKRVCYVVAEEGQDLSRIEQEIKTMPHYFADYDTAVHFISEEEMEREHNKMPHGGFVIRSGVTGENAEHKQIVEYALKLDSNPEFTASVLVAYARAAYRLAKEGIHGAKTVFDIAPALLSPVAGDVLRAQLL
jgi:diaminopimelate dehydrogenase